MKEKLIFTLVCIIDKNQNVLKAIGFDDNFSSASKE